MANIFHMHIDESSNATCNFAKEDYVVTKCAVMKCKTICLIDVCDYNYTGMEVILALEFVQCLPI